MELKLDSEAERMLLQLVAEGNTIVAEISRISHTIPAVFFLRSRREQALFSPILPDYTYLSSPSEHDAAIEASPDLVERDEDFRQKHLPVLEAIYSVFDAVHRYITRLNEFFLQLGDGAFVGCSPSSLLAADSGKQLLAEAVYLYGVILLFLDISIPGPVRERVVVAYYRYRGRAERRDVLDVCRLVAATGFLPPSDNAAGHLNPDMPVLPFASAPGASSYGPAANAGSPAANAGSRGACPVDYPVDYFGRTPPPADLVRSLVAVIRNDDLYATGRIFPSERHRLSLVSQQASVLAVLLCFCPDILRTEATVMRELADKHFALQWVVPVYLGTCLDLSVVWRSFKAARAALRNNIGPKEARLLSSRHTQVLADVRPTISALLVGNALTEARIAREMPQLLDLLRDANQALRWLLLHSQTKSRQLQQALELPAAGELVDALLDLSELEHAITRAYERLLQNRPQRFAEGKAAVLARLSQLADYFGSDMGRKSNSLQRYFGTTLRSTVDQLDPSASNAAEVLLVLADALDDISQHPALVESLTIRSFLQETTDQVRALLVTAGVSEDVVGMLSVITGMSYSAGTIDTMAGLLQSRIISNPGAIVKLRCLVRKLGSLLDDPVARISQAGHASLPLVAQFYSAQLLAYVHRVLAVVPATVLRLLEGVARVESEELRPLPGRIPRTQLRDYAQLDAREELAKATHGISILTSGVLAMHTTLVGVITVDPEEFLDTGVRCELVRRVWTAASRACVFSAAVGPHGVPTSYPLYACSQPELLATQLMAALTDLAATFSSLLQSLVFIQDHLRLPVLRLWEEELGRVAGFAAEQEANRFCKTQVFPWQSRFASSTVPIPWEAPAGDDEAMNRGLSTGSSATSSSVDLARGNSSANPGASPLSAGGSSSTKVDIDSAVLYTGMRTHVGRVVDAMLALSHPNVASFSPRDRCWVAWSFLGIGAKRRRTATLSKKSRAGTAASTALLVVEDGEMLGPTLLRLLPPALGVAGTRAVADLLREGARHCGSRVIKLFSARLCPRSGADAAARILAQVEAALGPVSSLARCQDPLAQLQTASDAVGAISSEAIAFLLRAGHMALLADAVHATLREGASLQAPALLEAGRSADAAIAAASQNEAALPAVRNVAAALSGAVRSLGLVNAVQDVASALATDASQIPHLATTLLALVRPLVIRMTLNEEHGGLVVAAKQLGSGLDAAPLVWGLAVILTALDATEDFLGRGAQLVRTIVARNDPAVAAGQVESLVVFLTDLADVCDHTGALELMLPPELLDLAL
jgi:WASH complex subunit strumpellin